MLYKWRMMKLQQQIVLEEVLKGKVDSLQAMVGSADFKSMLTSPHSSIESIYKKAATLKALERLQKDIEELVKLHIVQLTEAEKLAAVRDLMNDQLDPEADVNEGSTSDADEETVKQE